MLVVVVGPYTFESKIHKVAVELPIIEGLVGVRLCMLFVLQICLTGWYNEYVWLAALFLPCDGTIMRFIFQFASHSYTYNYKVSVLPLAQEIGLV